jgi:anti-sigma-K factor RskA
MIHDPQDLLAAYALDAVENEDRFGIEQHLAQCPRCQAEIDGYRDVAAAIGNSVENVPETLWSSISSRLIERPIDGVPSMPPMFLRSDCDQGGHRREGVDTTRRRPSMWRTSTRAVIAVAAMTVLAFLGISLAHANNQNAQLRGALGETAHTTVGAALDTPGHRLISLTNARHQESAQFVVLPVGRGYLVKSNLPLLSAKETYQLWGVVNGQPISIGILGRDPGQVTFTLAGSPSPSQLGINVEPAGGSVVPSSPMLVEGTI